MHIEGYILCRGGSTQNRCSRAAAVENVDPWLVSSTASYTQGGAPGSLKTTAPPSPVRSLTNRSVCCSQIKITKSVSIVENKEKTNRQD